MEVLIDKLLKGFVWAEGKNALTKYEQISNYIKDQIDEKDIPEGAYLPSTRGLAKRLSVSRSTIIKAYELLALKDIITSSPGAGYRIIAKNEMVLDLTEREFKKSGYPEISIRGKTFLNNVSLINSTSEKFLAFRPGLPPLDIFPVRQWQKLSNLYWRNVKSTSLSYSNSSGIISLKKNIAAYLNLIRGIKCDYRQVIVVSGSLQSLYLIGNALINPGDSMVMENPTFPNVHSIFKSLQAQIIALPLDEEGIQIKHATNNKDIKNPKLIHLTPSSHYPSTVKMSAQRKKEVLNWASKHKAIIIENDYDHEINNWDHRSEAIFNMDSENRTVYLGTFNRILHPAIRLGYMVVPFYLLETLIALQKHSHRFVSPHNQMVMSRFIEKNHIFKHVRNVIEVAEEREEIFKRHFLQKFDFPSIKLVKNETRSLHFLVELYGDTLTDKHLSELFYHHHLTTHAYSKCFVGESSKNGLILGYSPIRKALIPRKIDQMAAIYKKSWNSS